jgi:hypothetical protein
MTRLSKDEDRQRIRVEADLALRSDCAWLPPHAFTWTHADCAVPAATAGGGVAVPVVWRSPDQVYQ